MWILTQNGNDPTHTVGGQRPCKSSREQGSGSAGPFMCTAPACGPGPRLGPPSPTMEEGQIFGEVWEGQIFSPLQEALTVFQGQTSQFLRKTACVKCVCALQLFLK